MLAGVFCNSSERVFISQMFHLCHVCQGLVFQREVAGPKPLLTVLKEAASALDVTFPISRL